MWAIEFPRIVVIAAWAAGAGLAHAQAAAHPASAPGIGAARDALPIVTERDVQRARERHRAPSDLELSTTPARTAPRVDKLPSLASRAQFDLEALTRGFEAQSQFSNTSINPGPSLLVFVSFAMPDRTLALLAEQAARARATLVLRGLVAGSMTRTAARVRQLVGARGPVVQIDPQAFDRYAVAQTPAFVLVRKGAPAKACETGQCVPADQYAVVSGDVSLDYAVRYIQRSAPAFAQDAKAILHRLNR